MLAEVVLTILNLMLSEWPNFGLLDQELPSPGTVSSSQDPSPLRNVLIRSHIAGCVDKCATTENHVAPCSKSQTSLILKLACIVTQFFSTWKMKPGASNIWDRWYSKQRPHGFCQVCDLTGFSYLPEQAPHEQSFQVYLEIPPELCSSSGKKLPRELL